MKKELQDKIFNDFPELFKHKDNLMASLMAFGIATDDGWFDLIYNLCKDIKEYYGVVPDDFYVVQVKEKFGALRFYITAAPKRVHDLIHAAECASFSICERCGAKNDYKKGDKKFRSFYRDDLPWLQTLCDDCLLKHCEERKIPFKSYISSWQRKNKAPFVIVK